MHPRLVKALKEESEDFEKESQRSEYHILPLESQIEKLRVKVEREAKRRKIEDEHKKKKKRLLRKATTNNTKETSFKVRKVNTTKLPNYEANQSTEIVIDDKRCDYKKIEGLEHLYQIDNHVNAKNKEPIPEIIRDEEEKHIQEITALQPPPSEVLTLKAGVVLNENGNVVNGPDADYKNRMTKEQYQITLGSQTQQRKKFHENRLRNKLNPSTNFNTYGNEQSVKHLNDSRLSVPNDIKNTGILRKRINNNKSSSSIYNSAHKDSIMIHKGVDELKEELVTNVFKNPRKLDSKYSAALNDSFQNS